MYDPAAPSFVGFSTKMTAGSACVDKRFSLQESIKGKPLTRISGWQKTIAIGTAALFPGCGTGGAGEKISAFLSGAALCPGVPHTGQDWRGQAKKRRPSAAQFAFSRAVGRAARVKKFQHPLNGQLVQSAFRAAASPAFARRPALFCEHRRRFPFVLHSSAELPAKYSGENKRNKGETPAFRIGML